MQSTSFRLISVAVTILLLAGLALVVRLALRNNPTTAPILVPTRTPTTFKSETPTLATTTMLTSPVLSQVPDDQPIELATRRNVDAGGFSFQPLTDYTAEVQAGSVNMLPQNSGADDAFLLSGGPPGQFATQTAQTLEDIFDQYVNFYAQKDNFRIGARRSITVDDRPGYTVDLTSIDAAKHFAGRIVMAQPGADQLFVMVGVAPATQWQTTTVARYEAVLASVKLFAPLLTSTTRQATAATPTPAKAAATLSASHTLAATPAVTPTQAALAALIPTPTAQGSQPAGWQTYSNANKTNDLVIYKDTLWAATQGGVLAWNLKNDTFVKFTTLDGLAANQATAVVACPLPGLGIVFGSDQGLQIFDPQSGHWKMLNSSNSTMSFDDVSTLVCSVDNSFLIVGYRQHGLDIFDARTGAWTYVNQNSGLQNNVVQAMAVFGNRDAIWVSSGAGISVLTPQGAKFFNGTNSPLESNQITAITIDKKGTVWLGARDAIYQVSGETWTVYSQLSVLASRFPTGDMNGLAIAADGTLWIGSSKGEICHFDPVNVQCLDFFSSVDDTTQSMARGTLTDLMLDAAENVYYATDGSGISRYDGSSWQLLTMPDEMLMGNQVHALAQTKDGSIWVATEGGIQQLNAEGDRARQLFTTANSGLVVTETGVLQPDQAGGIWFGALGASYFNGDNWAVYTAPDGLANGTVQAIAVDNQQRVWFGTKNGLSVWNGSTFFSLNKQTGLPNDDVTALLADGDKMWIGTNGGGLFQFEKNQLQVFDAAKLGLPSKVITALANDADGLLLVGTQRGLARVRDGVAATISEAADFPITAIVARPDGKLWVGTDGNGLLYFDSRAWTQLPASGRAPARQISALLVDQAGKVWVGGKTGGLTRYTP
ncbi:MAG: hypothetical protein NT075_06590 [Chloroflexi bacterium]|nr:hypothetical protein [Chloroflexota bacterium]